ncbi:MAG: aldehyde ferredoxin oxidoreductase family protein [Promethearchaeota archaeon]
MSDHDLLRINLTTKEFSIEEIPLSLLKKVIGGKGLGTHYLLQELKPKIDPLSPESKIIFVSGPVTGTSFPTGNRYGILYKSPLTGTYAESYSGGGVAQKLRASGYYAVIIEGKSDLPIYLFISEAGVDFRDASKLWGKDTIETYDLLEARTRKELDILTIGPAGEKLLKIANVQNNKHHSAGRCGPGALMGSKLLKAIVFSGNKRPTLDSKPEFKQLTQEVLKRFKSKPLIYGKEGIYRKFGTPIIVDWANELGCFPSKYYTQGYAEHAEDISAHALIEKILVKRTGCWNCPFTCGKHVKVETGEFKCELEGPEYETIANFGGLCDIHDIEAIAMLNEFCDRMGIDTISAGALCALAIEGKKRNLIPELENSRIDYNKPMEILEFLKDMVAGKKVAVDFGMGIKHVLKIWDLDSIAVHVKGLDFAGYDPRAFRGFALSYGVSPEGPTHLRSVFHGIEKSLPNREEYEGKAEMMIEQEDKMVYIDSLIVCKFIRDVLDWPLMVKIYNIIYDENIDVSHLREILGDIVTNSRRFNTREGFSRKDDYLPERFFKEKLPRKPGTGPPHEINKEKYDIMLNEYYAARKWDENGIPPELD